jgi:DNA-binding transcriptional ArsR family regulator
MYWVYEDIEIILDRRIGPLEPEDEMKIVEIRKTINNRTRLGMLSSLNKSPMTVAMLAKERGISRPVAWRHVEKLRRYNLIKESETPPSGKKYKQEIFYENNFPILSREDADQLLPVLEEIERKIEATVKAKVPKLEKAWSKTSTASKGYVFDDVSSLMSAQISAGPCYRALRSAGIYREPITHLYQVSGVERGGFDPKGRGD